MNAPLGRICASLAGALALLCVGLSLAEGANDTNAVLPGKSLIPLAAQPMPLGSIRPTGWLRQQMFIQASGLSGHLDEFWPDVADSSWIGGKAEGWERGPYWLDGFIPLAVALDQPELKARAKRWVDYILKTQQEDGWLGPVKGNPDPGSRLNDYDVWPRFILLKALTQWQEATGDERVIPALLRFCRCLDKVLDKKPLQEWARVRWADLSVSLYWLHQKTEETWLLDLAAKVHQQGLDWPKLARDFPYKEKITQKDLEKFKGAAGGQWINDQFGATHGVNVAMGIKAPSVWSRQSGDSKDQEAVFNLLATLDRYHGQASGVFSCDEHLAGPSPSQGTELCAVVEMMYSLETLLTIQPEAALGDRLESLAYNALPAAFTENMWAHQYDQQANQVVCKVSHERVYSNNGPEANLFGLEPNFGCCLANFHQGWPKFAAHLWMRSSEGGLLAMAYAPCVVKTQIDGREIQMIEQTDYPFDGQIEIRIVMAKPSRFPIELRIPAWAEGATVAVNGEKPKVTKPGTFVHLMYRWSGEDTIRINLPMKLRVERRFNDSVSIYRGPILFALNVGQEWKKLRDRQPTADWEVFPTTTWNYALQLNPLALEQSLRLQYRGLGDSPFSPRNPVMRLLAEGRIVPEWRLVDNAADVPPKSPVHSTQALAEIELIPYGCAKLRVTEIPVLGGD